MFSEGAPFAINPLLVPFCQLPLPIPFFPLNPFSLTWNPSSCVVRSCPPWSQVARKLTSPSPFPPHSNFPTPLGFPKSTVRPSKMTSRSRLYIVRNKEDGLNVIASPTINNSGQYEEKLNYNRGNLTTTMETGSVPGSPEHYPDNLISTHAGMYLVCACISIAFGMGPDCYHKRRGNFIV